MPYKDPEKQRESQRRYASLNRAKVSERMRLWRALHRETVKEIQHRYNVSKKGHEAQRRSRVRNYEKLRDRDRLYAAHHPEVIREQQKRYRLKNYELIHARTRVTRQLKKEAKHEYLLSASMGD